MKPKPLVTDEENKTLRLKHDFSKAKQLIYGRAGIRTQDYWFSYYNTLFLSNTSDLYFLVRSSMHMDI